jgi:hypothetical protein
MSLDRRDFSDGLSGNDRIVDLPPLPLVGPCVAIRRAKCRERLMFCLTLERGIVPLCATRCPCLLAAFLNPCFVSLLLCSIPYCALD